MTIYAVTRLARKFHGYPETDYMNYYVSERNAISCRDTLRAMDIESLYNVVEIYVYEEEE